MERVLISIPEQLAIRMRAIMPTRQRSKTITKLLETEITKREKLLYECALAVEKDNALNKEMEDWDTTLKDGLHDESW